MYVYLFTISIYVWNKVDRSVPLVTVSIARSTLQMKGRWESNINVCFPFMYFQKWNCYFQNRIITVSQFLHSYICERFIHFPDRSAYPAAEKYVDRSWEYINRSQKHECGSWDGGCAIPRKEIRKWDFRCSVLSQRGVDQTQRNLHKSCQLPFTVFGSFFAGGFCANACNIRGSPVPGGHKDMLSILAITSSAPRIWALMRGKGVVAGSQPMRTAV